MIARPPPEKMWKLDPPERTTRVFCRTPPRGDAMAVLMACAKTRHLCKDNFVSGAILANYLLRTVL